MKRCKLSKREGWQNQVADELHKGIRRTFARRRVIVSGVDEVWAADHDLVANIYERLVPLKNKTAACVKQAFKNKNKLWDVLEEKGVNLYSTENEEK